MKLVRSKLRGGCENDVVALLCVWVVFESLFQVESNLYHGGNRYSSN
jgi:hypothetical protein